MMLVYNILTIFTFHSNLEQTRKKNTLCMLCNNGTILTMLVQELHIN